MASKIVRGDAAIQGAKHVYMNFILNLIINKGHALIKQTGMESNSSQCAYRAPNFHSHLLGLQNTLKEFIPG